MPRKARFNTQYFNDITNETAYWAGFIASDGCIRDRRDKNSMTLQLGVSKRDEDHLRKFLSCIDAEKEPTFYTTKQGYETVVTSVSNKDFCMALQVNFNIGPRKSLTYEFPTLEDEFMAPFIVGYIDGDGSFYRDKRRDSLCFSVAGTYQSVSSIRDFLCITPDREIEKHVISQCYYYRETGSKAEAVRRQLSGLKNVPYLQRKWSAGLLMDSFSTMN